jgi:hypothetical protein
MTIKDEKNFILNFWDWRFLDQAFDRNIKVGDIDGFVEAGGNFLFIEGKRVGNPLPKGQYDALTRLARLPRIDVIILEGNPPCEVTKWVALGFPFEWTGDKDEFAAFVRLWFETGKLPT